MDEDKRILERDLEQPGYLSEMEFPGPLTWNRILSLLVVLAYLYLVLIHYRFVANPESTKAAGSSHAVALNPLNLDRPYATASNSPHSQDPQNRSMAMATLFFLISLALPLFLIWYPEIAANWAHSPKKVFGASYDSREDLQPRAFPIHTIFIQFLGWLYLVGIPLLMVLLSMNVGP